MIKNFKRRVLAMVLIFTICIGLFLPLNVQANDATAENLINDTTEETLINDIIEKNQITDTAEKRLVDDTENNIYYISNISEIGKLGIYGNIPDAKFFLTTDIDFSSTEIKPFCDNFKGTFDGCGHNISFNIDEHTGAFANTQYLGLFSKCTGATIKNLYVNANISLTTGGSFFNPSVYIGGIVGSSTDSTIENVHVSGNINILTSNDNSPWVGGIVGEATNTKINLSSNTTTITTEANSYVGIVRAGGLCGEFSGTIENCYNNGDIQSTAAIDCPYAGGLVGINKGNINKSYNSGKVQSKGPSTSMSDIYAGGIVAKGENGSSVADCAVMSPEISVATGWINTGYKYIIANGGNKSNNISINSISGSPTNDSNTRYTQDELKTSAPYKNFDFCNTWAIDRNSNSGYPYHYSNKYAINLDDQIIPAGFSFLYTNNYIKLSDLRQATDGFTLCVKPFGEILLDLGITDNKLNGDDYITLESLNNWYLFNKGNCYSILKMKTGHTDKGQIGTSIPFMEFNINLLELLYQDLSQQIQNSETEKQLYNELYCIIYNKIESGNVYSPDLAHYFNSTDAQASYLIAEEYIRKVMNVDRDSEGYIQVPEFFSKEQKEFLLSIPNIYDEENNRIRVNSYNLTNIEKKAILVSRTGNKSMNNYAAENILHAFYTSALGPFLKGPDDFIEINGEVLDKVAGFTKFKNAIKADAGVGEEKFSKGPIDFVPFMANLEKLHGDV